MWPQPFLLSYVGWCWDRLKAGEGDRGWDGGVAPPTQWAWTWANSGRWWATGKPGMLQFMGCKEADPTGQLNNNAVGCLTATLRWADQSELGPQHRSHLYIRKSPGYWMRWASSQILALPLMSWEIWIDAHLLPGPVCSYLEQEPWPPNHTVS